MSVMRMVSVGLTLGLVLQGMGSVCAMYGDLSPDQQKEEDARKAAAANQRAEEEKQKISQAEFIRILEEVCRKEEEARKAAEKK